MTPEPDYQQQLRTAENAARRQQEAESRRRSASCGVWAAGLIGVPLLAFVAFFIWAQVDPAPPNPQVEFVVNCESRVKTALKAPSTAKISNAFQDGIHTTASGYSWTGAVDAQNSFGAQIRTSFWCHGPAQAPIIEFAQ